MNHWSESDFQNWLYGLREEDGHSAACSGCRGEIERLTAERQRIIAGGPVSHEFLASQRRRIYQRLDKPAASLFAWRWVLSFAMALVMVAGITVNRLQHRSPVISDEQLFRDLSSIEQSAEPRAIQPIHNLFEE